MKTTTEMEFKNLSPEEKKVFKQLKKLQGKGKKYNTTDEDLERIKEKVSQEYLQKFKKVLQA